MPMYIHMYRCAQRSHCFSLLCICIHMKSAYTAITRNILSIPRRAKRAWVSHVYIQHVRAYINMGMYVHNTLPGIVWAWGPHLS